MELEENVQHMQVRSESGESMEQVRSKGGVSKE